MIDCWKENEVLFFATAAGRLLVIFCCSFSGFQINDSKAAGNKLRKFNFDNIGKMDIF